MWYFTHRFGFSQTYLQKVKQVWKKLSCFTEYSPIVFLMEIKILLISAQFCFIFFHLPSTFSLLLFFTCRVVTFANTSLTTVFVSFPPFLEMTDFSTSKIFEPDMRSFTFLNFYHYPLPHCFGLHLFCSCVVFLSHSGCAN